MKNKENKEENYTFTLNKKEYKLLMSILEEAEDDRSRMSCNDPYKNEEKLFSKKERIEMMKQFYDDFDDIEDEEKDGFLFNNQYVEFIIEKIKQQKKNPTIFDIFSKE